MQVKNVLKLFYLIGYPNYRIIERPIWSTWARYKRDVNDSVVLNFANEIVDNGYKIGQFEIDDDWEVWFNLLLLLKFNVSIHRFCRTAMEH